MARWAKNGGEFGGVLEKVFVVIGKFDEVQVGFAPAHRWWRIGGVLNTGAVILHEMF